MPGISAELVQSLVRPDVASLEEYTPIVPFEVLSARLGRKPDEIIKLDANENPYGPSPKVIEALQRFPYYHIYPDPEQSALRASLESYTGVERTLILAGAGADELIDYLGRLFLLPGDAILDCPPTFGMYSFDAGLQGARVIRVYRRADFSLDLPAIEQLFRAGAGPKLLFVTSPNNPDGSLVTASDLRRLLALPTVVVLDEAYSEFSSQSYVSWVRDTPNLVVLRTFSKWAGLAGLRLGYGIFPAGIIAHLWKIKQPYNVNVAATVAGLASLADVADLRQKVGWLISERERLSEALSEFAFLNVYPSQANFVLCRVLDRPARDLKRALEGEGILVRFYNKPRLSDCIRISAGRPEQTDRLLAVLRTF